MLAIANHAAKLRADEREDLAVRTINRLAQALNKK
jgi:hypothetical protein